MKTYFEMIANTTYHALTATQKAEIQDRQTALVIEWQDNYDEDSRWQIEEELLASVTGLIKSMAYRQAEKSFSLDQEEFEGIISLVLAETMVEFDRTLNKPFQPVFITRVRYAILEMYRDKGYDVYDDSASLFAPIYIEGVRTSIAEVVPAPKAEIVNTETTVVTDEILKTLFGNDDRKKTIIHMTLQGFKRNEIVNSIMEEGKTVDSVAKMVNRTVNQFKAHYLNLQQTNLV